MGNLPYISSEQGWAYNTSWVYNANYRILYLYKNFELKRGWAYNASWAYNTYYTVYIYMSVTLRNAIQSQLHPAGYVPFTEYTRTKLVDVAKASALHRKVPRKERQTLMG